MTSDVSLKGKLQSDLNGAIKSRNTVVAETIRMVLSAITNEEVAGKEQISQIWQFRLFYLETRIPFFRTNRPPNSDPLCPALPTLIDVPFPKSYLPFQPGFRYQMPSGHRHPIRAKKLDHDAQSNLHSVEWAR